MSDYTYFILHSDKGPELEELVANCLREGYALEGGLVIGTYDDGRERYCQAVYRPVEIPSSGWSHVR